jgi:hypothetical protein
MDILRKDVDLVEEGFMEQVVPALAVTPVGRIIFVDGDNFHVLERDFPVMATAGQFIVQGSRGIACCESQPEQAVPVGVDGIYNQVGNFIRGRAGFREDIGPDFLVRVKNALRQVLVDEPAFVR